MSLADKPVLGYWNVRGIAQPIRYMLEYIGKPYEDKVYNFKEDAPPSELRAEWLKDKEALGRGDGAMDFPNLPYYMDGDVKITQSLTIMRYLGRKNGLFAQTNEEETQQDVLEAQVNDLRWHLIDYCKYDVLGSLRWSNYPDAIEGQMKLVSDYLGAKKWLLGDRLTYVDFLLYEALDQHRLFKKDCLDAFPNLQEYHERFRNLPAIKSYLASERFRDWPVFGGPLKRWGYKKEAC
ncbi:glutathione S-transferase Mu 1-like [Ornithodoros turicata]|uniref:glutathione S-transferase Mu 1-like n=1 Tax=Ornithodoros turicata TaxID=34597 RepID=UPI00313A150D